MNETTSETTSGSGVAFVFPGQGSQKIGMGRAWAETHEAARAVFAEADRVLGFPLSRLCWEGPEEELQRTANTQPALLTVSIAIKRSVGLLANGAAGVVALQSPVAMAGHSLGEYSALVAAGALSFADALVLVRRRGEAMQEAVPVGVGAMAAVLGLETQVVEELAAAAAAERGEVCSVANDNAPEQAVLAGHAGAVERASALARERGAKKVVALAVSAPFHCALMEPAARTMAGLLAAAAIADPAVPVFANFDARRVATGDDVRRALVAQVAHRVRWVESVRAMAEAGVGTFVELGPGKVLCGLIRRIVPGARTVSLAEPDDYAKLSQGDGHAAQ